MAQDSLTHAVDAPSGPQPGPEHKQLQVFVGKWNTEGRTRPTAGTPSVKVRAVDEYEWLPGEFFLLHRITAHVGDDEMHGIEIIGYDQDSDMYPMYFFDDKGTTTISQLRRRDDSTWTIAADGERATIKFDESRASFTAAWERRTNGARWEPWMDVKLTKAR
jgi:Protein of unknown function (DUF1579)